LPVYFYLILFVIIFIYHINNKYLKAMKKLVGLIILGLIALTTAKSQEFLLHDETFTWTADADPCGGFHYWTDYGNSPRMNWTTPSDYQHGLFYFRFVIIDQPTNSPFQLNFGIWTEFDGASFFKQDISALSGELAGSGSMVTFSSAMSPQVNGGIDWTDLTKLWKFGNGLYVNGHVLGNGASCTDHPEEWANVAKYLPLKIRVTVVAVPDGQTFSGWNNYIAATPDYAIDYNNVLTNKVVPATDEYSSSADMSGAVSGNGQKLTLLPGHDVYFRTKAANGLEASDVQHLVVPNRPATPSYTIDFANEKTSQAIPTTVDYDTSMSYLDVTHGTDSQVPLTPGKDLFFWVRSTPTSFYSWVYHLVVPARPATPAITVDYMNEQTSAIAATMEWADNSSMESAVSGTGAPVPVTPGTDLYIRTKSTASSFASEIQHLTVSQRPATPAFTIDYVSEKTAEVVPAGDAFSASADMSGSTAGEGAAITLNPGNDVYFQVSPTASSFSSGIFHLMVPARPVITSEVGDTITGAFFTATVDFHGDATGFTAAGMEATNAEVTLTDPLTIKVVPVATGEITIKVKANAIEAGNFASAVLTTYFKEIIISGIPDVVDLKGAVKVYPSPVTDLVTVEAGKNFVLPAEIMIIDGNGAVTVRKTMLTSSVTLDMSGSAHGLYILKAIDASGNVVTGKVIKK
jgi:hypothetical protein